MIVISKEKLSHMVVGSVICPIKADCSFETRFAKQIKEYVSELDSQFNQAQYTLGAKNLEIGEVFQYPIGVETNWQSIYFIVVKDFYNQVTFNKLSEALTKIILDLFYHNVMSICVPFLSLGYFNEVIEAEILSESFLKAYTKEPQIAQMKIVVKNDTREEFDAIIEAFEILPKQIYRKPKFLGEAKHKPNYYKKEEGSEQWN